MNSENMEQLGKNVQQLKDKGALKQLLQAEDTRRMMELLGSQGGVQDAAKAAAAGNPGQLMGMMQQLMDTKEGAQLVERITKQARKSGL